jgi:aspartate aminotransferase-like enzyme
MEAAVANCFQRGDGVLLVSNGYFGERFAEICRIYGVRAIPVTSAWGTSVQLERVLEAYAENPDVRGVLVVYSETSSGAVNDVRALGEAFRGTDVLVIVDAISGLISHPLEMDAWGLDVVLAASHKGFMLPPGLAFAALSEKAWRRIEDMQPPSFYFSFQRYRKFFPMAPSTPAISLLLALKRSLEMLAAEGLAACTARHARLALATQRALEALGFNLLVQPPHRRSQTVTVAYTPPDVHPTPLIERLSRDFGVTIAGGQGPLKGRVIRVGHVGAMDAIGLIGILGALEMALERNGHRFDRGAGLVAAGAVLMEGREDAQAIPEGEMSLLQAGA